ncbi:hypothetical protein [Chitinibacter tainanensis]|uniref:hypothetical protein n=1 Tax=Chitinibacter tainanensis TaxID=230667 RepID=UPI002353700E|nr:hypothetical protein [Chitinibacter tainanensis]
MSDAIWSQLRRSDYALIRRPVLWFGTALLMAGVLLLVGQGYVWLSQSELDAQQQRLRAQVASTEAAKLAWDAVQRHQSLASQLQRRGVLGAENRLAWVEQLAALARVHPEWQLSYSLNPRRLKEGATPEQGLALYASELHLQWQAGSEWDFSTLHAQLRQLPGQAVARECLWQRVPAQALPLRLDCRYDVLTMHDAEAP